MSTSTSTSEHEIEAPQEIKPVSKWKDPDFLRKYYREKRRQHRGVKRHPNVMDDGRKWSEHHPYGNFETKEEWLKWKYSFMKPKPKQPKKTCDLCKITLYESKWQIHLQSNEHVKNVELLKRHGIDV